MQGGMRNQYNAQREQVFAVSPLGLEIKEISCRTSIGFSDDGVQKCVTQILSRPSALRTNIEMQFLRRVFEKSPFFQQLERVMSSLFLIRLFKNMKYYFFEADKTIYKLGDPPTYLYILLSGAVCETTCQVDENNNQKSNNNANKIPTVFDNLTIWRTIGEGEEFGEISLRHNCPREFTVIAKDDCTVGRINQEQFNMILSEFYNKRRNGILEKLSAFDLFSDWPRWQIEIAAQSCSSRILVDMDSLYSKGDISSHIYFLLKGEVQISRFKQKKDLDIKKRIVQTADMFVASALKWANQNAQDLIDEPMIQNALDDSDTSAIKPVVIFSEGQIIGKEELFLQTNRETFANVCSSEVNILALHVSCLHKLFCIRHESFSQYAEHLARSILYSRSNEANTSDKRQRSTSKEKRNKSCFQNLIFLAHKQQFAEQAISAQSRFSLGEIYKLQKPKVSQRDSTTDESSLYKQQLDAQARLKTEGAPRASSTFRDARASTSTKNRGSGIMGSDLQNLRENQNSEQQQGLSQQKHIHSRFSHTQDSPNKTDKMFYKDKALRDIGFFYHHDNKTKSGSAQQSLSSSQVQQPQQQQSTQSSTESLKKSHFLSKIYSIRSYEMPQNPTKQNSPQPPPNIIISEAVPPQLFRFSPRQNNQSPQQSYLQTKVNLKTVSFLGQNNRNPFPQNHEEAEQPQIRNHSSVNFNSSDYTPLSQCSRRLRESSPHQDLRYDSHGQRKNMMYGIDKPMMDLKENIELEKYRRLVNQAFYFQKADFAAKIRKRLHYQRGKRAASQSDALNPMQSNEANAQSNSPHRQLFENQEDSEDEKETEVKYSERKHRIINNLMNTIQTFHTRQCFTPNQGRSRRDTSPASPQHLKTQPQ